MHGHHRTTLLTRPRSRLRAPHPAPPSPVPTRTLRFASEHCRLDVSIADEGNHRLVEGKVSNEGAVRVVHERLHDARSATVDRCGYFSLQHVPRGLGRLVLVTSDGRRLPTDWTMF